MENAKGKIFRKAYFPHESDKIKKMKGEGGQKESTVRAGSGELDVLDELIICNKLNLGFKFVFVI